MEKILILLKKALEFDFNEDMQLNKKLANMDSFSSLILAILLMSLEEQDTVARFQCIDFPQTAAYELLYSPTNLYSHILQFCGLIGQ